MKKVLLGVFALVLLMVLAAFADAGHCRARGRDACATVQKATTQVVQRTVTRERRVLIQRPVLRRGCR